MKIQSTVVSSGARQFGNGDNYSESGSQKKHSFPNQAKILQQEKKKPKRYE